MLKFVFILLALLLGVHTIEAQTHEWANSLSSMGGSNSLVSPGALTVDSNNNSYLIGEYKQEFNLQGDTFPYTDNYLGYYPPNFFLNKFDSVGQLKWSRTYYTYSTGFNPSPPVIRINNISLINNNRILVYGYFNRGGSGTGVSSVLKISPSDSIVNSAPSSLSYTGFFIIYNDSGDVVKCGKLYEGNLSSVIMNGQIDVDRDENIYVSLKGNIGTILSDKTTAALSYSSFRVIIAKFSPQFDSLIWHKPIATVGGSAYLVTSKIRVGIHDNNIYLASLISNEPTGSVIVDNVDYSQLMPANSTKGFLVVLSSSGSFIHKGFFNSDILQKDNLFDVMPIDTGNIYAIGFVQDSILYQNKWFSSKTGSTGAAYPFIARVSISQANWIKLSSNKTGGIFYFNAGFNGRLKIDKLGYAYSSFGFQNNVLSIGGLTDSTQGNTGFVKLDSLGNALWLRSGVSTSDMQPDMSGNLVYCGSYSNNLYLHPFSLNSQYYSGFVAKIIDYSITRGLVSPGPYCAGDTLDIPYTKTGEYDTANYFIAELSDDEGSFEGGERELGRLKSQDSGVVKGLLPLFDVASSGNYRIRIRSTHPAVQSFYKLDTLKLLIYSKDSADAGDDITICRGDTITLSTFGGTQWQWFPGFMLQDSLFHRTKAWPDTTTTYRVSISDSSGCGVTDTAYKTIFVRNDPSIVSDFSDTLVCNQNPLLLSVSLSGGDTANYLVSWYKGDSLLKESLAPGVEDTLWIFNVPPGDTTEYKALLNDQCAPVMDSLLFSVKSYSAIQMEMFADTTVCQNIRLALQPQVQGGRKETYNFNWKNLQTGVVQSADSLIFYPMQEGHYRVYLWDNCMIESDSADLTIQVYNPLLAETGIGNNAVEDTILCLGRELHFENINDTFTLNPGLAYGWYANGSPLGTGNVSEANATFIYNLTGPATGAVLDVWLRMQFSDVCSTVYDSVLLHIPAPLQIAVSGDSFNCPGTTTQLKAAATGGLPNDYHYKWYWFDQGDWTEISSDPSFKSDSQSFVTPIKNPQGTGELFAVSLQDGCNTDTSFDTVFVRYFEPLEILSSPTDTLLCNNTQAEITALASKGSGQNYSVSWLDENNNFLDTGFVYTITAQHSGQSQNTEAFYGKAVLTDGCMPFGDTVVFSWKVNPPLDAKILNLNAEMNDSLLCYGQEIKLNSTGQGGQGTGYSYQWKLNNEDFSGNDEINLNSALLYDSLIAFNQKSINIKLVLGDGCTGENDSAEFVLSIRDPLQVTLPFADTLCFGNDATIAALYSGGKTEDYSYQWFLDGNAVSSDSIYQFAFDGQSGTRNLSVSLGDNCSQPEATDTTSFLIREKLEISISADRPCADPQSILKANPLGGKATDYEISWFGENNNLLGTADTLVFGPDKTSQITVHLKDNCSSPEAWDSLVIYPQPRINITLSDTAGCDPLELQLNISKETETENLYSLVLNNQTKDTFSSPVYSLLLNKGAYYYSIKAASEGNCEKIYNLPLIDVWPLPKADFSWQPENPNWNQASLQLLNQSKGATSYEWDIEDYGIFSQNEPVLEIRDSGTYFITLKAITDKGCEDTIGKLLLIRDSYNFYIPNSFTPNDDHINNFFTPIGTGIKSYKIEIYNRWGQMIFTGDQNRHWDGKYLGTEVMEGVYIYVIKVMDKEGNIHNEKGSVVVLR